MKGCIVPEMGAFDTYAGAARCPGCGDIHFIGGQTKVFEPDFGAYHARHFVVGAPQPLGYAPSEMLAEPVWDDEWWRVRAVHEAGRLSLLADLDELFACGCGRPLAVVLRLRLDEAAGTAELIAIDLLDALADDVAAAVDLASSEGVVPWPGGLEAFRRAMSELATAAPEVRAARLRRALGERFDGVERWFDPAAEDIAGWTRLIGPVRCEACGEVRERALNLMLTHPYYVEPVLGPGFTGGVLRPGVRVAVATGWRDVDEDRGDFVRLRHPLPPGSLTICGGPMAWSCRCGIGPGSLVARFGVDDGGVVLESLSLRVVRSLDALTDVDLAHAPRCSRAPLTVPRIGRCPADRAEALACLAQDWRSPASR